MRSSRSRGRGCTAIMAIRTEKKPRTLGYRAGQRGKSASEGKGGGGLEADDADDGTRWREKTEAGRRQDWATSAKMRPTESMRNRVANAVSIDAVVSKWQAPVKITAHLYRVHPKSGAVRTANLADDRRNRCDLVTRFDRSEGAPGLHTGRGRALRLHKGDSPGRAEVRSGPLHCDRSRYDARRRSGAIADPGELVRHGRQANVPVGPG